MDRAQLEAMKRDPASVPCNGCTACCRNDRVKLTHAEVQSGAFAWHQEGPDRVLDRTENGACVYLSGGGCGIHGAAPDICRRMDCRVLFLLTDKQTRRQRAKENPQMKLIYAAARSRLKTLHFAGS